jgi:hypothetical protein
MGLVSIPITGTPGSSIVRASDPVVFRVFDTSKIQWTTLVDTEIDGFPRSVFEYKDNGIATPFVSIYPAGNIITGSGGDPVNGTQATDPEIRAFGSGIQTNFNLTTNNATTGAIRIYAFIDNVVVDDCTWEVFETVNLPGCFTTLVPLPPGPGFPERGPFMNIQTGGVTGLSAWFVQCTTPLGGVSTKPFNMTVIPS